MKMSAIQSLLAITIKKKLPVLITGAPGVGKTDGIVQACESAKADLITFHPVVSDPTDFKGMPAYVNGDHIAEFVPFRELQRLVTAKRLTVGFFDDLGQSPPAVQAACFPAGTSILLADGVRDIEYVQQGDTVIDANGNQQRVTSTFNRQSDDIVNVTAVGVLPIRSTTEHPFLVSKGRKRKYAKQVSGHYAVVDEHYAEAQWTAAKDIQGGDWIAVPVPQPTREDSDLMIEYKGQTCRHVALTTEFAKLCGYYAGDGWYTQHKAVQSVAFALDIKYPELHDDLKSLLSRVFDTTIYSTKRDDNNVRIQIHDPALGEFFSRWIGNRSRNKRIPEFILWHRDLSLLTAFLQGYLNTDGAALRSGNSLRGIQWGTVSRTLALQLQIALTRYGVLAPVKFHCRKGQTMKNPRNGKEYPVQDAYVIQCSDRRVLDALQEPYDSKRRVCWSYQHEGKIWTRVKSVRSVKSGGLVYNLEVTGSHTYTANNVAVHNCMQLFLARRLNDHIISDHVVFIAATNRRTDKAGVSGLLEPVKSRFATIVGLEPDVDEWVSWALTHGMPTELIGFIRFRPGLLFDFKPTNDLTNTPNPRTVSNVGRLYNAGIPKEIEFDVFSGAAGDGFSAEFTGFLRIFRELPTREQILMNPDKTEIPSDPAALYATSAMLAAASSKTNFDAVVTYANRMPDEFSVVLIKDAINTKKDLTSTRAFQQWATKHTQVLI